LTTTAPITARTATSLTFTAPAAPGDYHVLVTNAGGRSLPVTADVLGFRTPVTATTTARQVSAAGGTVVTLTGTGFGTTATAFGRNLITATVNGKTAAVRWVTDTTVTVTVPAGAIGAAAPIVLLHDKVPGAPITGVTYAAAVSRVTNAAGARTGWTTTVSGIGFAGSGSWQLVDADGATVVSLPVVSTSAALTTSSGGVLRTSNTAATVKLPATAPGRYRLTFVPDQAAYPGSSVLPTDQACVAFRV
jgi:IPT/TIG domain